MVDFKRIKMLRSHTPIEDHTKEFGLFVKREDLSCKPPGPPFSKTRGVYARVKSRPEKIIGVLDTYHSQAGHAVARACQLLGKECWNFYPVYKREGTLKRNGHKLRPPQVNSQDLGAKMKPLQAGRSCILFHAAKKATEAAGGYMMPNALKLEESVVETAKEVPEEYYDRVIIPSSSGTIAKGVIEGFCSKLDRPMEFIIHLGYSRSHDQVLKYVCGDWDIADEVIIVDEGYNYKDTARPGETPPWPCNPYYDLKAFRWYLENRFTRGKTLFWNIG